MSSRRVMTLGFEEMKGLGGMLVLKEWSRGFVCGHFIYKNTTAYFLTSVLTPMLSKRC